MNGCIFWDDEDNKFISFEDSSFTKYKGDDFIILMKEIDSDCSEGRAFDSFDFIGITDINDEKIYANCSIVEYGAQKWKVIYNVFQLRYELECISNINFSNMVLSGAYKGQLKIIDTIQENKLGLIK